MTPPFFQSMKHLFDPPSMVTLQEILSPSFKDYGVSLPTGRPVVLDLWQRCWSLENQFCKAVVSCGYLSYEQMACAAVRYRVGTSKNGGVIFWQIDHEERIHDGKVVYYEPDCHRSKRKELHPIWVSSLLARRCRWPDKHQGLHCLFGLHLLISHPAPLMGRGCLSESKPPIAIVEAEKTAFILSELYPNYLWLASGGLSELQPYKFRPLRGRRIILFPDTDPDGTAFRRWHQVADEVMRSIFWEGCPPIRVSAILEQRATAEQKARKIDLVDFIFTNGTRRDEGMKT